MKPASELTRSQLEARMDNLDKRHDAICTRMIAEGRGRERPSETRLMSDPLSLQFIACANALAECYDERSRRLTYHGSLRPIKRIEA